MEAQRRRPAHARLARGGARTASSPARSSATSAAGAATPSTSSTAPSSTARPRSAPSAARSAATASSTGAGSAAPATTPPPAVLETSPRMPHLYRERMGERVDYVASDYDESMHRAFIKLDLQDMDLPSASVDVVLTPARPRARPRHRQGPVGAVPGDEAGRPRLPADPRAAGQDDGAARAGVPRRQARSCTSASAGTSPTRSAPPASPATPSSPASCATPPQTGRSPWTHDGPDCDVEDLIAGADPKAMTVVADAEQAARHSFRPAYQFVTFDCHKPAR